jgi:hypothetical protein
MGPLDQFRAFPALRDKGLGEAEIAARFFVTPTVVKQRLRLGRLDPRRTSLSLARCRRRWRRARNAGQETAERWKRKPARTSACNRSP